MGSAMMTLVGLEMEMEMVPETRKEKTTPLSLIY
jgi:hypothetical protein